MKDIGADGAAITICCDDRGFDRALKQLAAGGNQALARNGIPAKVNPF